MTVSPAFPTVVVGETLRLDVESNAGPVMWEPINRLPSDRWFGESGVLKAEWPGAWMAKAVVWRPSLRVEVPVLVATVATDYKDRSAPFFTLRPPADGREPGAYYVQTAEAWEAFGREVASGKTLPEVNFHSEVVLALYAADWTFEAPEATRAPTPQLVNVLDDVVQVVRPEASRQYALAPGTVTGGREAVVHTWRLRRSAIGLPVTVYSLGEGIVPQQDRIGARGWYPASP